MKKIIKAFLPIFLFSNLLFAQSAVYDSVLNKISLDSLKLYVRQLSGDTSCVIAGSQYTILSRHKTEPGNNLAAQYIYEKLQSYGLYVEYQKFSSTGSNVIGTKYGYDLSNKYYVVCGHFDNMPPGPIAPGADDNASGTAAVIELARIFSEFNNKYTIKFIAFDEEEQGLIGSAYYASKARANGDSILGVINADMIGYDGNNDGRITIHAANVANSKQIAIEFLYNVRAYEIALDPVIVPSQPISDHDSFLKNGYGAISIIEPYADFNPKYHTIQDKIEIFDLQYFLNGVKATGVTLAHFVFEQKLQVEIYPTNLYSPPFVVRIEEHNATSIVTTLKNNQNQTLGSCVLYDDGINDDGFANNGIWGNLLQASAHPYGAFLNVSITYNNGITQEWKNVVNGIPTIGRLKIEGFTVVDDNINRDLIPNPGEQIRYRFRLRNYTNYTLTNIYYSLYKVLGTYINSEMYNDLLGSLTGNSRSNLIPEKYFTCRINPLTPPNYIAKLIFKFSDDRENFWIDTLQFEVENYTFLPIETNPTHLSGISEYKFGVRLVNYNEIKDNNYLVSINKYSDSDIRFNLVNTTLNDTLLRLHQLPDEDGFNVPVTDGFIITRGSITTAVGAKRIDYSPIQNHWFAGGQDFRVRMDINSFNYGAVVYPRLNYWYNYKSGYRSDSLRRIEIRFSNTNTQKAYRYIYGFTKRPKSSIVHPEFRPFVIDSIGFGYLYQDYEMYVLGDPVKGRTIPFTVWEVDHRIGNGYLRQLDAAIVERNDTLYRWIKDDRGNDTIQYVYKGNIDGKWNPAPLTGLPSLEGDETIIILGSTYTDTAKSQYTKHGVNLSDSFSNLPLLYAISIRKLNDYAIFQEGDVLSITPYYPLTENDVFVFNPKNLLFVDKTDQLPENYVLYNNYPNPFNPQTTIQFDLPKSGKVVLEVYNLLGQKICTLVDEYKQAGSHSVVWNGKATNGQLVASGVYFYYLRIAEYTAAKKMILTR